MTRAEMETRRLNGVVFFQAGLSACEVARRCEVSRTSALRWRDDLQAGKDLHATKGTGRPNRLNTDQWNCLRERFKDGVTRQDLRAFIFDSFKVWYSDDHVYRLCKRLGIRPINAKRRATQFQKAIA